MCDMGLFDKILGLPNLNEIKGNFGEQLAKYYSKVITDTLVLHDVLIFRNVGIRRKYR